MSIRWNTNALGSCPFLSWGSNWRFTVPLSRGKLEITSEPGGSRRLRYDFSTRRLALVGAVAMIGMFAVISLNGVAVFPWWVPVVGWLWLVGINYLIALARAPSWVRRRVSGAVEVAAPLALARRKPNEA